MKEWQILQCVGMRCLMTKKVQSPLLHVCEGWYELFIGQFQTLCYCIRGPLFCDKCVLYMWTWVHTFPQAFCKVLHSNNFMEQVESWFVINETKALQHIKCGSDIYFYKYVCSKVSVGAEVASGSGSKGTHAQANCREFRRSPDNPRLHRKSIVLWCVAVASAPP